VAAGSDPNWLLIGFFVLAVVLAYVAGRATGPVMEFVADWRQRNDADSQVIGRQALQDLRRLLPDLQRAGETSGDPEAHGRSTLRSPRRASGSRAESCGTRSRATRRMSGTSPSSTGPRLRAPRCSTTRAT